MLTGRRPFGRAIQWAWALLLAAGLTPVAAGPLNVAIVVSDESGAYLELADSVRKEIAGDTAGRSSVAVFNLPSVESMKGSKPAADVVVAVGVRAAQAAAAADFRVPILNALVPRSAHEKISRLSGRGQDARQFSAIYLDQPLPRQLQLIRLALPERARIGAILGPDSQDQLNLLQATAKEHKLQLHAEKIGSSEELIPALQRVLAETDVLLALPDPLVFNSGTIQNILLTSYRYQDPVIGFSPAYVRAGALLAVYSTPADIGRQVAEVLKRMGNSGLLQLPAPQFPRYYRVSVNHHVARSLGFSIEDEKTLLEKLKQAEREP